MKSVYAKTEANSDESQQFTFPLDRQVKMNLTAEDDKQQLRNRRE